MQVLLSLVLKPRVSRHVCWSPCAWGWPWLPLPGTWRSSSGTIASPAWPSSLRSTRWPWRMDDHGWMRFGLISASASWAQGGCSPGSEIPHSSTSGGGRSEIIKNQLHIMKPDKKRFSKLVLLFVLPFKLTQKNASKKVEQISRTTFLDFFFEKIDLWLWLKYIYDLKWRAFVEPQHMV